LTRIFSFAELRELCEKPEINNLILFHTRYKYLLLTYNQKILRELGKIVADGKMSISEKIQKYKNLFYQAFIRKPSSQKHINTLLHLYGYHLL